jgi:hypothetical protein
MQGRRHFFAQGNCANVTVAVCKEYGMSFGGQIGQHRPNARVSEREKSLSQEDVTAQQVSHDPAAVGQGVRLLAGILTLLLIAFCYFASSVCITVVVATFLAILLDPVVAVPERARIPDFSPQGQLFCSACSFLDRSPMSRTEN